MEEPDELDLHIDILINEELSKLITHKIGPFTCQFLKYDTEKGLMPFASGIMVELNGSHFILTASHVIEDWSDANKLFIEIENGHISVVGKASGTETETGERIDVAYIKLKDELIPILRKWYKFLTAEQLLHHNKIFDEGNYCAYGFPVINFKIKSEIAKSVGSAYFMRPTTDKVFEFYKLSPLSHYILEFHGKPINIKTNQVEKIKTEHYGLSGGGLWYTKMNFVHNRIISKAQLIGIMIEFRKGKYECLIANRVEIILALIEQNEGIKIKRTL
jgi:hypothetical protein